MSGGFQSDYVKKKFKEQAKKNKQKAKPSKQIPARAWSDNRSGIKISELEPSTTYEFTVK